MTPRPTGRRQAEWERRRTRGLALLEQLDLSVAVIAIPGNSSWLTNGPWTRIFTRGTDAPLARLPPAVVATLARIVDGHPQWFPELELVPSGVPTYAALSAQPLHDAHGLVVGAVLVGEDTTDEVLARRLGVSSDVLVWSGALAHEADYANPACRRQRGANVATPPNIHRADRGQVTRAFGDAMRGEHSHEAIVRLCHEKGASRWYRISFVVEGGRWYGLARDVDEAHHFRVERDELMARERAAREQVEQANRMKDEFLSTVSHELRAPLTTMLLWETLLREGGDSPPLRQRALDVIRSSAQTQSRIVGDLLDVSRAVSGKLHVDLRRVSVAAIVDDAVAAARAASEARDVALVVVAEGDLGDVDADESRLRQVFGNLLSNAIKFSEPHGRVTVSLSRGPRRVSIAIQDDGRGIAAELMPRLFQPFTQMNADRDRYAAGLGVGLAIAKQLVELHRGTLEAKSSGVGRGATFTVVLPTVRTRRAQTPPDRAPLPLSGIRTLVVDDDSRVRDALALLLARAGSTVRTADSAESARARLSDEILDVLVCDIAMPGEDGYSFLRDLRARGIRTPAVAVTARGSPAAARQALAAGFDRHLAKPIDIEHLIESLRQLVGVSAG